MVVEQIFYQALQLRAFLPQDFDDFALPRRERPDCAFDQELGTFTQGGQRRLQLVRDVPQKQALLLLELDESLTQPVEPDSQVFQVGGPDDAYVALEFSRAQAPDRLIELPDGSCDEDSDTDREKDAERYRCRQLQPQDALGALTGLPHRLDFAVDQGVARVEHVPREIRQDHVSPDKRGLVFPRYGLAHQLLVQRLLGVDRVVELPQLGFVQRLQRQLAGVGLEIGPESGVILEQLLVVEDQVLAHDALQGRRLLDQEAASARCFRRLRHGGLTV